MGDKYYLFSSLLGLLVCFLIPFESLRAKPFFPFNGRQTAWYFNLMDGRVAIGLKGPFSNKTSCQQNAQLAKSPKPGACYERETVAYFRWRQNQVKTWVLPVRTGAQWHHLIFRNRKNCHRVAESGFYITPTGKKVQQHPDLKYCLLTDIYFDAVKKRYTHLAKHPPPEKGYPQRYKAWSMVVEEGRYRKLLQFRNKQQCQRVAHDGKYFSFLPRAMFGTMRVVYQIPQELRKCVRRTPQLNEIPVIYQHIQEHETLSSSNRSKKSTPKTQNVWTLTIQKPGGPLTLFFEKRKDCFRIEQQKFYYKEINRGQWIPSKPIQSPFENILQACTQMKLSKAVQERFYPFADKH